jgi:hypothetical protein
LEIIVQATENMSTNGIGNDRQQLAAWQWAITRPQAVAHM